MDRVVRTDQEIRARRRELFRRGAHQRADASQIVGRETRHVVGERRRVHGDFGMGVRSEKRRRLLAYRLVAERRALGRTADDADVLGHGGKAPSAP